MDPRLNAAAAKAEDPSSSPRTHEGAGDAESSKLFSDLHSKLWTYTGQRTQARTLARTHMLHQ